MQGFGVGLLLKRFEEKNLIKWAAFGLVWAWLLMVLLLKTINVKQTIKKRNHGIYLQYITDYILVH